MNVELNPSLQHDSLVAPDQPGFLIVVARTPIQSGWISVIEQGLKRLAVNPIQRDNSAFKHSRESSANKARCIPRPAEAKTTHWYLSAGHPTIMKIPADTDQPRSAAWELNISLPPQRYQDRSGNRSLTAQESVSEYAVQDAEQRNRTGITP
ncbi:MAG: hypothetical protein H6965_06155 [Chromatiaceae bacterium]|nr:hypothetical protein [Chromatiaceae bacterium]